MYLATFRHKGKLSYGFRTADERFLIDAVQAEKQLFREESLPKTLLGVIESREGMARLQTIRQKESEVRGDAAIPIAEVTLEAPIPEPKRNIFCLGLNYRDHALEFAGTIGELQLPEHPIVFTKATTAVIGPNHRIKSHRQVTSQIDYEAELAIVIGKEGTNISKQDAYDYIFGYTIMNDVTARDLQKRSSQWFVGKSLDTFAPMGPFLVTEDEIGRPVKLDVQCRVNGELRQHANTELLIFDIPTIIASLSAGITLKPGDIIATGTPKGVGMAFDPPKFLNSGDVVEVEIERIGLLRNALE